VFVKPMVGKFIKEFAELIGKMPKRFVVLVVVNYQLERIF